MSIKKPIYLEASGWQAQLPDGAVINIGGTNSSTFTVDGRGLVFEDGGNSRTGSHGSGGGSTSGTLQGIYNNSSDSHGHAVITLQTGKDFIITDDTNALTYFKIQSTTGDITVTGNLTVLGSTTLSNTTEVSDHWTLRPSTPGIVSLSIEPAVGNIPSADLMNIKIANAGSSVFRVDATGKTILKTVQITGNATVVGLINGQDIVALANELDDHLFSANFPKHTASQIQVTPNISHLPGVTNVQAALLLLATQVSNVSLGSSLARGFEYIQTIPASTWQITHGQGTRKVQFTAYDADGNWLLPNSFKILTADVVEMGFGADQAGSVVLMMF